MALATLDQGGETQSTDWMLVLVTARHRRLYAFAGLVYDRKFYFPTSTGSGSDTTPPTPTDTPIALPFALGAHGSAARPASPVMMATPAVLAGGGAPRLVSRPDPSAGLSRTAPIPPSGSRSAGPAVATMARLARLARLADTAPCPEARDIFPPVLEKNCALRAEQMTIERGFAGIMISARAADDPRPAPRAGHRARQLHPTSRRGQRSRLSTSSTPASTLSRSCSRTGAPKHE